MSETKRNPRASARAAEIEFEKVIARTAAPPQQGEPMLWKCKHCGQPSSALSQGCPWSDNGTHILIEDNGDPLTAAPVVTAVVSVCHGETAGGLSGGIGIAPDGAGAATKTPDSGCDPSLARRSEDSPMPGAIARNTEVQGEAAGVSVPQQPPDQQRSDAKAMSYFDSIGEAICNGCGQPMNVENAWMYDGCPCNSGNGCNDNNPQRWKLLWQLQQQQSREREDLAMLIRRLVHKFKDNPVAAKALDYLKRKGLQGSPLREEMTDQQRSEAVTENPIGQPTELEKAAAAIAERDKTIALRVEQLSQSRAAIAERDAMIAELRKIAAHVPGKVYLAAKEAAGFGNTVHAKEQTP